MSTQIAYAANRRKRENDLKARAKIKPLVTEQKEKPSAVTTQVILTSYKDYPQWRETSEVCLMPKHGQQVVLFSTLKSYKPEEPEVPSSADYRGAMKDQYIAKLEVYEKEIADLKKKAPLFFGDILLTISKGAMEKLKESRPDLDGTSSAGSSSAGTSSSGISSPFISASLSICSPGPSDPGGIPNSSKAAIALMAYCSSLKLSK
jgi:hypothetical protein